MMINLPSSKCNLTLLTLFLLVNSVFAVENMTFPEAYKIAETTESNMSDDSKDTLTKSQGEFLVKSVISCINDTGEKPKSFSLVVKFNAQGNVTETWKTKSSDFLDCFESEAKEKYKYVSGEKEFYSFIKVNL
ncbi:hypothetical protein [Thalassotalea sp. Y01]|uniref:hypothetical protein n=1 Tax=Thalassotalea sp. Y01 TaxID=2729613 RepID=UPI00145F5CCE|nr:hypothetical protein [Thalassotalea sp. Y01]NMP15372.1 hypothetical protein [Thalassotalea sp. Y01]